MNVEKMSANLKNALHSSGSFTIRGLYEKVAYLGNADQVLALQADTVSLTPISLALDCRIDFRTSLAPGMSGTLADGILSLDRLTIDLRRARPVDLALKQAARLDDVLDDLTVWRELIRSVLMETIAGRENGQTDMPGKDGWPVREAADMTSILGIGDLMAGLERLSPLPQPARPHGGVDVRGAFVRHLNRFLEHAAANTAAPVMDRMRGLAQDLTGVIGLGPGLTPSGDDFLIGLLSVLWFLHGDMDQPGRAAEEPGRAAKKPADGARFPTAALQQPLRQAILQKLSATTLISAAFMREAAAGRFNEHLLSHYGSVASGDWTMARRHLMAVARAGHSSGTDTLGGMLLGLGLAAAGSEITLDDAERTRAAETD